MIGSDKWFKWCFNIFIFLMCVQLGMLMFLKSLFYQAEQRMEDNEAQVSFACGDHNNDEAYWSIPESAVDKKALCNDQKNCPESLWVNPEQKFEKLHVVSVARPRPSFMENGKVEPGHFVDVQLESFKYPTTLVLISQTMLQWNVEFVPPHASMTEPLVAPPKESQVVEDISVVLERTQKLPKNWKDQALSNVKEVIVIGPELVWIDGLPTETKVTYFTKDQLCAYPIAWEELGNSENEFRRLALALKEYTGKNISSFQGKKVGRFFKVPFLDIPNQEPETIERGLSSTLDDSRFANGIHWKRKGKSLLADHYQLKQDGKVKTFPLPEKTMQAHYDKGSDKLFVIRNFQFGTWDKEKSDFNPIHAPLTIPALRWPSAMTFNPYRSEIYLYNDDRGGEIYVYNVVTESWRVFAKKVGYSLVGLHYDKSTKHLLGPRYKGHKISEIVKFDGSGRSLDPHPLPKPLDFSKNKWRVRLVKGDEDLWLKVSHPAEPGGELHPIFEAGQRM